VLWLPIHASLLDGHVSPPVYVRSTHITPAFVLFSLVRPVSHRYLAGASSHTCFPFFLRKKGARKALGEADAHLRRVLTQLGHSHGLDAACEHARTYHRRSAHKVDHCHLGIAKRRGKNACTFFVCHTVVRGADAYRMKFFHNRALEVILHVLAVRVNGDQEAKQK